MRHFVRLYVTLAVLFFVANLVPKADLPKEAGKSTKVTDQSQTTDKVAPPPSKLRKAHVAYTQGLAKGTGYADQYLKPPTGHSLSEWLLGGLLLFYVWALCVFRAGLYGRNLEMQMEMLEVPIEDAPVVHDNGRQVAPAIVDIPVDTGLPKDRAELEAAIQGGIRAYVADQGQKKKDAAAKTGGKKS